MNEINKKDINTSNVIHLDASKDLNTITKCFNLCKTNEYALQSLVNKEITNKTHYWEEERQLEKQIGTNNTFKDFSFTKFELLSSPFKNEDDFAFIFHRLYKIGVNYNGKEYITEYKNKYFGPFYKLEVKYSKEAIDEGNKKAKIVRKALLRSVFIDLVIFILAFGSSLAIFLVDKNLTDNITSSEKFIESWMKYFVNFPNSLIVIVFWILIVLSFIFLINGWYDNLRYFVSSETSNSDTNEEIYALRRHNRSRRKLFIIFVFLTFVFAAIQSALTIYLLI